MSNPTPLSAPLGPLTPVLDEGALAALPDYLSVAARRSLRRPSDDLVLAALSAGQLLRVSALRQAARAPLVTWFCGLDEEALDVLGGAGEQILAHAAAPLGDFLRQSPEAQDLLDPHVARPVVDSAAATHPAVERGAAPAVEGEAALAVECGEPSPAASSEEIRAGDWLRICLLARDQAESLIVLLGKIALENSQETLADTAARWERLLAQEASSLDETALALGPLLGDHLVPALLDDPWLRHVSSIQLGHWWTTLLRARALGPALSAPTASSAASPAASPVTSSATSPAPSLAASPAALPAAGAKVIFFVPRRMQPAPAKLAAHSESVPPLVEGSQWSRHGELGLELSRLSDPNKGDFVIDLWLDDGSSLSLAENKVELLDAQGNPRQPTMYDANPNHWWGVIHGDGHFRLCVAGMTESIEFEVRREG